MAREIFPNLVDVAVANFVLTLAANVGIETGISLLGFGLGWDHPSLGTMIQRATNPLYLQHFWWVWVPALVLVLTLMLCVNFVGNVLQRVADPRQRLV
jgi:peptide/nickel transport system permease protein